MMTVIRKVFVKKDLCTIHKCNLSWFVIETHKVEMGLLPTIKQEMFDFNENLAHNTWSESDWTYFSAGFGYWFLFLLYVFIQFLF